MVIAVASGKGGTGKTTVSVNMARVILSPLQLLDCDVEEPNAHLFFKGTSRQSEAVTVPVPQVEESRCDGCGECSQFCEYNAIVALKTKAMVFPELCHSCGGCSLVCPWMAISESQRRIGVIETMQSDNITLIHGCLDVGVPTAPPLIRSVKTRLQPEITAILDAPPGTSCPVVTTIMQSDFIILVTEPTPFGEHDLKLAIEMVRELGIPHGVVINRMGIGDDRINTLCEREKIPILLEIPNDRRIAEACSRGELIVDALPEYRKAFEELARRVLEVGALSEAEAGEMR
jgi:MinD superfamily P-loop ATPase